VQDDDDALQAAALPHFPLFDSELRLEPVRLGPESRLAVHMPVLRDSMSRERLHDFEVVVEAQHQLITTDDGYAGRYEVIGFAVHQPSGVLTPEVIRSMPLGEIFSRALSRSEAGDGPGRDPLQLVGDRIVRLAGYDPSVTVAMGLDSVQPNEHERICLVYTLAKLYGQDTNRAVAEYLSITPAAAAQQIRLLRRYHKLPPASRQGARRS
jgi:hypothetical protein